MRQSYTEADIARVHKLRAEGKTWDQVANDLGRNPKAVYSKFAKMRRQEAASAPKVKRKYVKKHEIERHLAAAPTHTRPMVAFIGTPEEITKSIRELFS